MQIPILSRYGQHIPWTSIPSINWQHPLAKGLVSYCLQCSGGVYIDLVTGSIGQRVTNGAFTAPILNKTTTGQGWKYTASGSASITVNYEFRNSSHIDGLVAAAPYTAATGIISTATPTGTAVCFANCDTANNTGVAIGLNTSNNLIMSYANGSFVSDAAVVPTNKYTTLVATCTAATAGFTYSVYPGTFLKTAQTASTFTFTGLQPCIADATIGTGAASYLNFFNGYIYYGAVWKRRALRDSEVRQLHNDPWCFLLYPEDYMFATLVGTAISPFDPSTSWIDQTWPFIGKKINIIGSR